MAMKIWVVKEDDFYVNYFSTEEKAFNYIKGIVQERMCNYYDTEKNWLRLHNKEFDTEYTTEDEFIREAIMEDDAVSDAISCECVTVE